MVEPQEVLKEVIFYQGFPLGSVEFNNEHGFFVVEEAGVAADAIRFLAFGSPLAHRGGIDMAAEVSPVVNLADLHEEHRTIGLQGKGVGPRMYNTPQAALGYTPVEAPEGTYIFGAYTFDLDPERILDMRPSEGNALSRIVRHARRIVRQKRRGLAAVVDEIHASYEERGEHDAVSMTQPPNAKRRQVMERHYPDLEGYPAQFMIIRNAAITLRNVGLVNMPKK